MHSRKIFKVLTIFATAMLVHAVYAGGRLAPAPKPEDFLSVVGLDLTIDGEGARFWGTSIILPSGIRLNEDNGRGRPDDDISRFIARAKCRGDNIVRVGGTFTPDRWPAFERIVGDCSETGIRVWNGIADAGLGMVFPGDAIILDDPASDEEWRASMDILAGDKGYPLSGCLARAWDPRMELLYIQRLRISATHFNEVSGLKLSEDPVVSVWELDAIDRWRARMLEGEWLSWPIYFKKLLLDRWNVWLYKRYGTAEAIELAWGTLLSGESLDDGTILMLPLSSETDTASQIDVYDTIKQPEGDLVFSATRRRDVVLFLQMLWLEHKSRVEMHFRRWGAGTRRAPLFWQVVDGFPLPKDDANAMAMRLDLADLATLAALSTDEDRKAVRMSGKSVLSPVSKPCFLIVPPDNSAAEYAPNVPWHVLSDHFGFSAVCWENTDSIAPKGKSRSDEAGCGPFNASLAAAGILFTGNVGISGVVQTNGISLVDDAAASAVCGNCSFKASWRSPKMGKTGFSFAIRAPLRQRTAVDDANAESPAAEPPKPYADVSAAFSVAAVSPSGAHLADSKSIVLFFSVILDGGVWPEDGYRLSIDPTLFRGCRYQTMKSDGQIIDRKVAVGESQIEIPLGKEEIFRVDFTR